MSKILHGTTLLWIALFIVISFFHSYIFSLQLSETPGFYSNFSDVIIIGAILIFISLASTLLLFIWMIYLIRKNDKTKLNLLVINLILMICGVVAFMFVSDLTASWYEGFIYTGSYTVSFVVVINRHFFKLKDFEEVTQNLDSKTNN